MKLKTTKIKTMRRKSIKIKMANKAIILRNLETNEVVSLHISPDGKGLCLMHTRHQESSPNVVKNLFIEAKEYLVNIFPKKAKKKETSFLKKFMSLYVKLKSLRPSRSFSTLLNRFKKEMIVEVVIL